MNDYARIIAALQTRATTATPLPCTNDDYQITFKLLTRESDLPDICQRLADLGETGAKYFLKIDGPDWVRYFKGRRWEYVEN
jgi:hypothetical protein